MSAWHQHCHQQSSRVQGWNMTVYIKGFATTCSLGRQIGDCTVMRWLYDTHASQGTKKVYLNTVKQLSCCQWKMAPATGRISIVLTPQCCHLWTRSAPYCTGRGGASLAAHPPIRRGRRRPPCWSDARSRHTHMLHRHNRVKFIFHRQTVITRSTQLSWHSLYN